MIPALTQCDVGVIYCAGSPPSSVFFLLVCSLHDEDRNWSCHFVLSMPYAKKSFTSWSNLSSPVLPSYKTYTYCTASDVKNSPRSRWDGSVQASKQTEFSISKLNVIFQPWLLHQLIPYISITHVWLYENYLKVSSPHSLQLFWLNLYYTYGS